MKLAIRNLKRYHHVSYSNLELAFTATRVGWSYRCAEALADRWRQHVRPQGPIDRRPARVPSPQHL